MKLYHFSIVFSIVFLALIHLISWEERCADELEKEKRILEKSVERAADAAAGQLAVYCDGMLRVDREQVLESFFNTLYAGLGVLEYESLRQQVSDGLVFFLIAAEGTIDLWERQECTKEHQGQNGWKTLVLPDGAAGEEGVKILEQVLSEAAGRYGENRTGTEFVFQLPYQDACLWLRGVDEPCVMALWNGRPYVLEGRSCGKFFFSGAVVHKKYREECRYSNRRYC